MRIEIYCVFGWVWVYVLFAHRLEIHVYFAFLNESAIEPNKTTRTDPPPLHYRIQSSLQIFTLKSSERTSNKLHMACVGSCFEFSRCIIIQEEITSIGYGYCHWLILSPNFKIQNKYIFGGQYTTGYETWYNAWALSITYSGYQINIHLNLFTAENWTQHILGMATWLLITISKTWNWSIDSDDTQPINIFHGCGHAIRAAVYFLGIYF